MNLRGLFAPAHPLRRVFRQYSAHRRLRGARRTFALPPAAIYFPQGGLGDDLLGTAVAHLLHQQTGQAIWALSRHPDIYRGNPAVNLVLPPTEELATLLAANGVQVVRPVYTENLDGGSRHASPTEHILAIMARAATDDGALQLRPHLYLSDAERAAASFADGAIILQSSGLAARFPIRNKEWLPERFGAVTAAFEGRFPLLQIGAPTDPTIPGTQDLRGRTDVRHLAAIFARARLFIGLVGFPMHLARAVDCPAVVIYGGREAPEQSGYIANTNLYRAVPCAPCWLVNRCDFGKRCMQEISSADVVAAAENMLTRPRTPLAVETIQLGSPA